jgi:hypothetical protein
VNLTKYLSVQKIPAEILAKMSAGEDDDHLPPSPEKQTWDITPQFCYNEESVEVANDQDRRLCYYCGHKSQTEWEQQKETSLYFGHVNMEPLEENELGKLTIGKLTIDQRNDATRPYQPRST